MYYLSIIIPPTNLLIFITDVLLTIMVKSQRAFRERKERHVRDLEAKLHFFATRMAKLQEDNERLEGLLRRVLVEKEKDEEELVVVVGRREGDEEEEGERLKGGLGV